MPASHWQVRRYGRRGVVASSANLTLVLAQCMRAADEDGSCLLCGPDGQRAQVAAEGGGYVVASAELFEPTWLERVRETLALIG